MTAKQHVLGGISRVFCSGHCTQAESPFGSNSQPRWGRISWKMTPPLAGRSSRVGSYILPKAVRNTKALLHLSCWGRYGKHEEAGEPRRCHALRASRRFRRAGGVQNAAQLGWRLAAAMRLARPCCKTSRAMQGPRLREGVNEAHSSQCRQRLRGLLNRAAHLNASSTVVQLPMSVVGRARPNGCSPEKQSTEVHFVVFLNPGALNCLKPSLLAFSLSRATLLPTEPYHVGSVLARWEAKTAAGMMPGQL